MKLFKKWFLTKEEKEFNFLLKQIEKNKDKKEMVFEYRSAAGFFEGSVDYNYAIKLIDKLKEKGYNAEIESYYDHLYGPTKTPIYKEQSVHKIKITIK